MCGIVGIWRRQPDRSHDALRACVTAMNDALAHRGPDDDGDWVDEEAGIAFAQRRLAIIDLSAAGHQPMHSSCGSIVINYNGELYNTAEVRNELLARGRSFKGHSDTEVIVEACAEYGVSETVKKLSGMFAMAIWDRRSRELFLVRDQIGIKPLYWANHGGQLIFGSELKALVAAGGWTPEIDRHALSDFFRFSYIPGTKSIWQGVSKLAPGVILRIGQDGSMHEERFWDPREIALSGVAARARVQAGDNGLVSQLDDVLTDSVRRHMVSDVPLGVFLSGGVDSSVVTALMQKNASQPVKTFSIGFHEETHNEADFASATAKHLGTDHTEIMVGHDKALDVVPNLPEIYDEPFADPSQIPTFLVCEATRRSVTVALSGDGGDELFAGYARYALAQSIKKKMAMAPAGVSKALAKGASFMDPAILNTLLRPTPFFGKDELPGNKINKLAGLIAAGPGSLYRNMLSTWPDADAVVLGGRADVSAHADASLRADFPNDLDYMQYIDTVTYLPEDILTKVDRASMAVSLEARVPILTPSVMEFAWSLPQRVKVKDGVQKWILKQVLYKYVPQSLADRPKQGFGIPLNDWLRGPLKEWAEDLLRESLLEEAGFLDAKAIRDAWRTHQSGQQNLGYKLWVVLMFQAWLAKQKA